MTAPPSPPSTHPPELLAPAGAPDCLPAAVAGGADAVYLGLRHFNARGRAENFRRAELPRHVAYLRHHGLKCYVALNTLVHDDEHPKALALAEAAAAAGVDALIVQDLGLWMALRRELPRLEMHASTQMTVHEPGQLATLAELGARRVILARELTLAEIAACAAAGRALGVEVEVFIHGALCYAFSGQCLISNFAGCRSANRGTCAQNCRFDYRWEGRPPATADAPSAPDSLISLKDLALVERLGELIAAGVASFKIEGRLKGPDYVYTVCRVYRAALAAAAAGQPFDLEAARELLKDVFARPHADAALNGGYGEAARLHRHDPDRDRERDAVLESADRRRGAAVIRSRQPIRPGQGFTFSFDGGEGGFLVIAAAAIGPERWRCAVRLPEHGPRLSAGLALFRNADHERRREAAAAMAAVPLAAVGAPTVGVRLTARGHAGEPLTVTALTEDGRRAEVSGEVPLRPAATAPLTPALLTEKLGALGGTGFHADGLDAELDGALFAPAAELKAIRRRLVAALVDQAVPAPAPTEDDETAEIPDETALHQPEPAHRGTVTLPALWVAVGSLAAAEAVLAAGAEAAWLDDPRLDLWRPAPPTLALGSAGSAAADSSLLRSDRIWLRHPATVRASPHLAALGLPVVAGHLGVLRAARAAGLPAIADVFLNAYGLATIDALAGLGAEGVVLSLECSSREIARLAERRTPGTNEDAEVAPAWGPIAKRWGGRREAVGGYNGQSPSAHGFDGKAGETEPRQSPGVGPQGRRGEAPETLIAIIAHGRVPALLTRQDHGLAPGDSAVIKAVPRDGGLPYEIQRRAGGDTVVWEGRRLCAPGAVAATIGAVDAWVLELANLDAAAAAELTAAYVGLRSGSTTPAALTTLAARHAPHGLFPGHLLIGSRALDAAEAMPAP